MSEKGKLSDLIILDILRGYSVLRHKDARAYFKHFSVLEFIELDEFEEDSYEDAIRSGIKSEKDLIESAIEIGSWSKSLEEEIDSLKWTIEKQNAAIAKMKDQTQKILFEKSTKGVQNRYDELEEKRRSIVGFSAESLALRKRTEKLLSGNIYKDKELTEQLTDEECDDFGISFNLKIKDLFDHKNLIRASYSNLFFEAFCYQNRDPIMIFGKKFTDLTFFQTKVLGYAFNLLAKLKYVSDIPKDIMNDPVRLIDYQKDDKHEKGHGSKVTEGVEDLKEKMKKKGKITSEDLLS